MSSDVPPLNLLTNPWLPVRRKSGKIHTIRPAQLVEDLGKDPIVAFVWPRADFQIAALEFFVGLLATAFPPADDDEWCDLWQKTPDVATLDAAFARLKDAFQLDGPGPRFLQDFEDIQSDNVPIERLLIEAPGESTVRKNTDLFVHREQIQILGRSAAAMALFTLQSWAPSGGAGNRTGMRGGGPLLTFILPYEGASLWEIIWANVPVGKRAQAADFPQIFPWLAPTIESKGNKGVYCGQNAHPLQCWWGMPRRIRLNFEATEEGTECHLTGKSDSIIVREWRQRPYGARYVDWTGVPYEGGANIHPLTPRYRAKETEPYLSIHPQSDGMGYRHWVGLVVDEGDDKNNRLPASVMTTWQRRARAVLKREKRRPRLLAAGYDMDNMKARNFIESHMPLTGVLEAHFQKQVDTLARAMIAAARLVVSILRSHVKDALFGAKDKVAFDTAILSDVQAQFWSQTEDKFFKLLDKAAKISAGADETKWRWEWFRTLGRAARNLFDTHVVLTPETDITEARRIAEARKWLFAAVSKKAKGGRKVRDTLGLPDWSDEKKEEGHE